jgi:hypothetical protein
MRILQIVIFVISGLLSSFVLAGQPTCHSSYGGYCAYTGKVQRIYINSGNLIRMYFDTPVPLDVPAGIGYNVTQAPAAAIRINSNPDFAKLFYSTALAAQASGRNVTIQMRGTTSGYLLIDRIWLAAP